MATCKHYKESESKLQGSKRHNPAIKKVCKHPYFLKAFETCLDGFFKCEGDFYNKCLLPKNFK